MEKEMPRGNNGIGAAMIDPLQIQGYLNALPGRASDNAVVKFKDDFVTLEACLPLKKSELAEWLSPLSEDVVPEAGRNIVGIEQPRCNGVSSTLWRREYPGIDTSNLKILIWKDRLTDCTPRRFLSRLW